MFCNGGPLTDEHVWSQWISKTMTRHPKGFPGFELAKSIGTEKLVELPSNKEYEVTAHCVCEPCNTLWMSKVETDAIPYLEPMILGDRITLDAGAQRALATWAVLKVMVAQEAHPPFDTQMPDEWPKRLYADKQPSKHWRVWAAAYDGSSPLSYSIHQLLDPRVMPERADKQPSDEHGVLGTIVLGYAVFKVIGVYRHTLGDPSPNIYLPLWPPSDTAPHWPPRAIFNDASLGQLFGLWLENRPKIIGRML